MTSQRILFCLIAAICYQSFVSASISLATKSIRATGTPATKALPVKLSKVHSFRGGEIPFHDLSVSAVVMGLSSVWLKAWTTLAKTGMLESTLTRKIIHCGSAPLFIAQWPLYSSSPYARYYAALIPLFQLGRLFLAGTSSTSVHTDSSLGNNVDTVHSRSDNELIQAVSRTGNKAEALGGPLIYVSVLLLGTLLFFRDSPVGIVAIAQMAAGDGMADIVGRQYGRRKWPFAPTKSIIGSVAFVLSGFLVSAALLALMNYAGIFRFDVRNKLWVLLAISVFSAAVELAPGVDDNISVPIAAAAAAAAFL